VAEAPAGSTPAVDGEECVDWCWIGPRAALEAYSRGEMELVFPTIKHLEELAQLPTVEAMTAEARSRVEEPSAEHIAKADSLARVIRDEDLRKVVAKAAALSLANAPDDRSFW